MLPLADTGGALGMCLLPPNGPISFIFMQFLANNRLSPPPPPPRLGSVCSPVENPGSATGYVANF